MKKYISIILVSWLSMYSLAYAEKSNTLILLNAQNIDQTQEAIDFVKANGGNVRHVFPPDVLIGYVPLGLDHKLISHSLISQVLHGKVDPSNYFQKDKTSVYAVGAWNDLLMMTDENRYDRKDLPQPLPLVGDAYPPLEQLQKETGQLFIKSSTVPHTSWYMIGRVAVGIILMESNGSAENWTSEKEQTTISEIVQGHERLSSFAYGKKISVTWFYDIHYQVPTPSEPIQEDHVPRFVILPYPHWVYGWVNDALDHLGYDHGYDGMYEYINDRRAQFQTEWGYMIFVVMDEIDPDHMFPDEGDWFAYAQLQGPCMVMTYYNDNWLPWYMDEVLQHETCHIFGANDEYAEGCGSGDCDNTYGYLDVVNGNCESCNGNPDSCIMRSRRNQVVLCNYTNGQIGWRDSDGNYIPDPLDMGTQHSENLWDVYLGDLITIYNEQGQLVKVISVSPDNCDVRLHLGRSVALWDATNNTGDAVAYAQYYWRVNGVNRENLLWYTDTYAPYFTECSLQGSTLYFRLHDEDTAGGYVTITAFDANWNVVGYVMRHKFLACRDAPGEPIYQIQIPSELLGSGYIKLSCSDGGGNNATPCIISNIITLLSPNGGEQWEAQSTHDITWNFPGVSGNVKIQYSTNGGASWTNIVSSTPDDGVYSWTLPISAVTIPNCKVKILDATDGFPWDISDSSFSITPGPVYAPTNVTLSTEWGYGIRVSWTDNNANDLGYKIERKDSTNLIWEEIHSTGPYDQTWFQDTINLVGSETYWYRIRAYNETRYSPYSEEKKVRNRPNPPSNFTGHTLCGNSNLLFLSWEPPENQKLPIKFYDLYITDLYKKNCERYFRIYGLGDTVCLDHNLAPEQKYTIKVLAWDTLGSQGHDTGIEIIPGPVEQCSPELCQGSEFEILWSYVPGDANGDRIVNSGDIIFLTNYLFFGRKAPCIPEAADAIGDCLVNSGDIIYLVAYLFRGGPAPKPGCWHGRI